MSSRFDVMMRKKLGTKKKIRVKKGSKEKAEPLELQRRKINENEDDDNLYTVLEIQLPLLVQIFATLSLLWEILLYFTIVINYFLLTYGCFFTYFHEFLWDTIYVTDFIFGTDVLIRLGIEMWRNIVQTDLLVFRIPYRFRYCILDLISLFPLYVIAEFLSDSDRIDHLSNLDFYRLNSFIYLYRIHLFFDNIEEQRLLSEEVLFVIRFSNLYLGFINLVSCMFFRLTNVTPTDFLLWRNLDNLQNSWAKDFQRKKPQYGQEPWDLYILSTHFSTATVTTVGYGDVHGQTELEMSYCIIIMLIGAIFLNGYFTSQITNFQLELDGARFDLFFRLDAIKNYLAEVGMTPFFQAKVELYYKCLWTYREGVHRVSFIDHLPRSFQEDMYYDVCTEMFHKSYLFQNLDEAFLRAVSKIVKIELYNSDMILCRYGGYANQMYYILQGECQAMSKHESSKRAAILRAGSIIGEMNLFFSCPYTVSVETNTCCQFISIDKVELMSCFNKFSPELDLLRVRSQTKINAMYDYYEEFGQDPICWLQQREEPRKGKNGISYAVPDPTCTARWGDGLNQPVTEDVILDVDRFVIFETPCSDKKFKKNHVTPYMTCVVPEILNSELNWVLYWNWIIMVFAVIYSITGPYCLAFGSSSRLERYICQANHVFQYINMVMFILDVVVEVLGACPVEGLYYRFHDGLQMKLHEILFYFDILAAAPVEPFQSNDEQDTLHIINVVLKSMKIWKVIRYLKFLDNVYPKDLFWFRLCQTFLVLMYGIHFISCIVFFLACPTNEIQKISCEDHSWISSYKTLANLQNLPVDPEVEPNILGQDIPYLLSFYFSAATLTSAGFGDFNPQNIQEIIWTIFFQLIGFFIIGYYTAVLTSALACTVKPRLEFQQKLVAVNRFMKYYNMPLLLLRRVVEHYELQHQLHNGVNLPPGVEHYLFDSPDYLKSDVLYTDVVLILDGIPLFSKTESRFIIKMAEIMKRYLIPPNVIFLHRGEVRRSMYAIRHGSIGMFDGENPKHILESTSHFGIKDLLFGEPAEYDYKTLSYCLLYEIKYSDFLTVFEDDEELIEHLKECKEALKAEIEEKNKEFGTLERKKLVIDRAIDNPSWVIFKDSNLEKVARFKYYEYVDYFKEFTGGRLWRMVLMNGTVQQTGLFARLWTSWMSLSACISICLLIVETFTYLRSPKFRIVQWTLDVFFFIDIYVRLHFAYYLDNGLLVSHPLKTAGLYFFEGSFFIDVLLCAPVELLMWIFSYTSFFGYGVAATWYTKLRWIRFLQIKRVPQIFKIIHKIFIRRNAVLFMLYVSVTILVCTIVASIALYIGCPWSTNDWQEGDEYRLPFCLDDTWASTKFGGTGATSIDVMADFEKRWVVGIYYVCQVILVIGFGDMITLTRGEITLLIFMSVFGFIFMRCVIADITAAEVDSDEIRSRYVDKMKRLMTIMTRENVSKKLIIGVQEHLNHTWKKSKGLQPGELFSDLHPALESDLYQSYVGDKLKNVPAFKDFPPNALRDICQYVKKLYCLKGERLTRFGNLEYEMHIIISGKVWITDRKLNYGCTLHKNESFGETSMINCHARRYTVIAATFVEAFVITHADFKFIIERYPTIKDLLNSRTGNCHYDYFEYKIYDMIDELKVSTLEKQEEHRVLFISRSYAIKTILYNREGNPESEEEESEDEDALPGRQAMNEEQVKKINSYKDRFKDRLTSSKDRLKECRKRFCSYGYEDDNLSFIYFATQRSRHGTLTWWPPLIHPNCGVVRWFLKFVYVLCILYPAVATYEVCFIARRNDAVDYVGKFIHLVADEMNNILLVYVVLQFFLPFKDDVDGKYVKSSWSIAVNYVTSPDGAIIDVTALVAGFLASDETDALVIANNFQTGTTTVLNRYYSLFVLLWLVRYYGNHFSKRDDLSISSFRFKITVSVSSFCLMAHLLACIFYLIAECDHNDPFPCLSTGIHAENTWTHQFAESSGIKASAAESMKPWRWWIRSLYWVVTVISTTGFGDITPQNVIEMIMGIICVFSGAFILSIILSHFTAGIASFTKAHREYLYQVKLLIKYLRNIGLSSLRQEQINFYFEMAWHTCRGTMYHEAISILPSTMQTEVANALFEPVLKKVSFFQVNDETFLRQVAARVTHSMYLPGVSIVKEGDQGDIMYIVYKGRVSGIVEGDDENHLNPVNVTLKNVYLVGDVFGKFPALFHDEWYRKSYRAEEPTEVLGFSQYHITHLAAIYEEFWTLLLHYVEMNYEPDGGSDCIFVKLRNRTKDLFDLGDDYRKHMNIKLNDHDHIVKESGKKADKKRKKMHAAQQKKKKSMGNNLHAFPSRTGGGPGIRHVISGKQTIKQESVPPTGIRTENDNQEAQNSEGILKKQSMDDNRPEPDFANLPLHEFFINPKEMPLPSPSSLRKLKPSRTLSKKVSKRKHAQPIPKLFTDVDDKPSPSPSSSHKKRQKVVERKSRSKIEQRKSKGKTASGKTIIIPIADPILALYEKSVQEEAPKLSLKPKRRVMKKKPKPTFPAGKKPSPSPGPTKKIPKPNIKPSPSASPGKGSKKKSKKKNRGTKD